VFGAVAKEKGILFIPGIEIQTSEEIHLLGYFPDILKLETFFSTVVEPGFIEGMKNIPHQFGSQLKIDKSGKIIGEEETMLSMPLTQSIDELVDRIHDFGGIAVAAHIDRGFSVVSQLGYIPPQLQLDAVEIWDTKKIEEFRSDYLKERDLNILSSSDSHYIDMMKAPKMKFWLNSPDIRSFFNCILGQGPGRISIEEKKKRVNRQNVYRVDSTHTGTSKKDWKSMYGQP